MGFWSKIGRGFRKIGGVITHPQTIFRPIGKGVKSIANFGKKAVNWSAHAVKDVGTKVYDVGKGVVNKVSRVADAGIGSLEGISGFLKHGGVYILAAVAGLVALSMMKGRSGGER